jgi:hypothetical protein
MVRYSESSLNSMCILISANVTKVDANTIILTRRSSSPWLVVDGR